MAFWLEIKPLRTGSYEPFCLKPILHILYNLGVTFRFLAINCESGMIKGKRAVRFFFELQDESSRSLLERAIPTIIDVEVSREDPPNLTFEFCYELTLEKHYSLPILDAQRNGKVNPFDKVISALIEGGAVEVIASTSREAERGIRKYIMEKLHGRPGLASLLLRLILGIFTSVFDSLNPRIQRRESEERDPFLARLADLAEKKRLSRLFKCKVRVYGCSSEIKSLIGSLPSNINRFKVHKIYRKAAIKNVIPARRHKHKLKLFLILTISAFLIPPLLNPAALNSKPVSTLCFALAALSLTSLSYMAKHEDLKVVLSIEEIASIVSLPSRIGRLPLNYGAIPSVTDSFLPIREVPEWLRGTLHRMDTIE